MTNELENRCADCGVSLPAKGWEGLCPICLTRVSLAGAVDQIPTASEAAASGEGVVMRPENRDDYELLEEIGRGGMGVVYCARQRSLDRLVAVKFISSEGISATAGRERFRTEAAAVAQLRHPNIISIYESGEWDGRPFFSMELIRGRDLAALVRDHPLPWRDAAGHALAVARAIEHAHERGVTHRDLKPSNVLIDDSGRVCVTDFGLAKLASDGTAPTLTGQTLGSPNYLAPEQIAPGRQSVGPACDIHAVGAILYQLLTGRPPFMGESIEATLLQVLHSDPAAPRQLNPAVPPDVETICLRCLQKDPPRRYLDASLLAADLERCLNGEPILARPVGLFERSWLWARRRPSLACSIAVAMLAVVSGFVLTFWQWRRAEEQADRLAEALLEMRLNHVEAEMDDGRSASALASLARMLREEPGNALVARRLMAAISQGSFPLPTVPPLKHPAHVTGMRCSPDERHVLTTCDDGRARLWDTHTGELLLDDAPSRGFATAVFSPDGERFATIGPENAIRVWLTADRRFDGPPLKHQGPLQWIAFLSEQRLLAIEASGRAVLWSVDRAEMLFSDDIPIASLSADRRRLVGWHGSTIEVRDAGTRALIQSFTADSPVAHCCLSRDGNRVLALTSEHSRSEIRSWDVATGNDLGPPVRSQKPFRTALFTPDGQKVLATRAALPTQLFDLQSGDLLAELPFVDSRLREDSISADGRFLVTWYRDRAQVSDLSTGTPIGEALLHEWQVTSARFIGRSSRIVTTSLDGTARLWDPMRATDGKAGLTLPHRQVVTWIEFSPDGHRLATASKDGTARVWQVADGSPATSPLLHGDRVNSVRFSPDGSLLVTACRDGSAQLWNARTGTARPFRLEHEGPVRFAEFSGDGSRVVTASADGTACVWSVRTGARLCSFAHSDATNCARFAPGGREIATGTDGGAGFVWSLESGEGAPILRIDHASHVWWLDFSPDGRRLVTASADGSATVWNWREKRMAIPPLRHEFGVNRARFNRDGSRLLTASIDSTAHLWDVTGGGRRGRGMVHRDKIYDAVSSPNERFVLTVSEDDTARIWCAETGLIVSEAFPQGATMAGARFSPDGTRIAVAGPGTRATLWDVSFLEEAAPEWLPDFAEAVAGRRQRTDGSFEPVPWNERRAVFRSIAARGSGPSWAARYFPSP